MPRRIVRTVYLKAILIFGLFLPSLLLNAHDLSASSKVENFYSLSSNSIDGHKVDFSIYRGKLILAVNVASQCGYTPQYKGLEKLYEKFKDRGLVVLGFPSNDFGEQEPGSDAEIKSFCNLNYHVQFPIFSKSSVTGDKKSEVYKFLTGAAPADQPGEVQWNFEKFLIDRKGRVTGRYRSKMDPEAPELIHAIEKELNAK